MKILLYNVREYIVFLCGMCGELDSKDLSTKLNRSRSYIDNILADMKNDKYIRRFRYKASTHSACLFSSNYTQIRLKPSGEDMLDELAPELFWHYNLIVPPTKKDENGELSLGRFSGSDVIVRRRRRQSEIIQHFIFNNIRVDFFEPVLIPSEEAINISSTHRPHRKTDRPNIFTDIGILKVPNAIMNYGRRWTVNYFSIRALGKYNVTLNAEGKSRLLRSFGLLTRNNIFYVVYMVEILDGVWRSKDERATLVQIEKLFDKLPDCPPAKGMGDAAIVYTPNREIAFDFLKRVNDRKRKVRPEEVYKRVCILPINDADESLETLLLIDSFSTRFTEYILEGLDARIENERLHDAIYENQQVFNLIGNDYCKIIEAKKQIGKSAAIIIVEEWQEEAIREFFDNDNLAVWVYSKEEIEDITADLLEDEREEYEDGN